MLLPCAPAVSLWPRQVIWAILVTAPGAEPGAAELRDFCKERLAPYQVLLHRRIRTHVCLVSLSVFVRVPGVCVCVLAPCLVGTSARSSLRVYGHVRSCVSAALIPCARIRDTPHIVCSAV